MLGGAIPKELGGQGGLFALALFIKYCGKNRLVRGKALCSSTMACVVEKVKRNVTRCAEAPFRHVFKTLSLPDPDSPPPPPCFFF